MLTAYNWHYQKRNDKIVSAVKPPSANVEGKGSRKGAESMIDADYRKMMNMIMILGVLKKHSDENNPINTQTDIARLVDKEYGVSITHRKAIKNNLIALERFLEIADFGYRLEHKEERPRINAATGEEEMLYFGWYLERDLTDSELHLLIDGLLFSKYIPYSTCKGIVDNLEKLSSMHFKRNHMLTDNRPENKQITLNIEVIREAIKKRRKVSFEFSPNGTEKDSGASREKRIVSPYETVITNGRCYLICAHDTGGVLYHYRVDFIREIKLLENEQARGIQEFEGNERGFDLEKYMREHIYMYSGKSVRAEFIADKSIVFYIRDWFGSDVVFHDETEDTVKAFVTVNEKAMLYWALQFGNSIEVIAPESLRNAIKESVAGMYEKYC
jgi:predicted DNA-binding transcriptional regulator YafY